MKNLLLASASLALAGSAMAQSDLMITGILDGPLTGGSPKLLELYAINDIADLSKYAVSIAANGASTWSAIDQNYILPNVALSAGSYFYAVGNSFTDMTVQFDQVFPGYTSIRARNYGANSNGDDVEGLFYDASGLFTGGQTLVDVFGQLGVDGTGTTWEHLDGWFYSNNNRTPSATFNVNDWYGSGIDALDPFATDPASVAASFPDQTFVAVPEPSALALLGLGSMALLLRRRR